MIRPCRSKDFYEIPVMHKILMLYKIQFHFCPGIMFLSGGMTEKHATVVLNEIGQSDLENHGIYLFLW